MKYLTAIILLIICLTTEARTFYPSPLGSDANPGTLAAPCYTLNRVWLYLAPGDSVVMRGGIYKYNQEQQLIAILPVLFLKELVT